MSKIKHFWAYEPFFRVNIDIFLHRSNNKKVFKKVRKEMEIDIEPIYANATLIHMTDGDFTLVIDLDQAYLGTLVHEVCHIRQGILDDRGFFAGNENPNLCSPLSEAEAYLEQTVFQLIYSKIGKYINHKQ